jgi:predicted DNA binding CopG/RHH family protein
MKPLRLDKEEREILKSFERGEWRPVKDLKREVLRHERYARSTLRKDKRVNIRISSKDLDEVQAIAIEQGIPYQTLMASIIHRYVSFRYKERNKPNKEMKATR